MVACDSGLFETPGGRGRRREGKSGRLNPLDGAVCASEKIFARLKNANDRSRAGRFSRAREIDVRLEMTREVCCNCARPRGTSRFPQLRFPQLGRR